MDEKPKPKKPPLDLPRAPKPGESPDAPPPEPPNLEPESGQIAQFKFTDGRATSIVYGDREYTRTR